MLRDGIHCVIGLLLLFPSTYGQKIWDKKSYKEWTMSEVEQILNDSPWAQTQIENVHITYEMPANSYIAIIRLRSAVPIRQALLRQKQLQMNYDRFTTADKVRFDNETKEFVECSDCSKYYIVTIRSPVRSGNLYDAPGNLFDIVGQLKSLSIDELKKNVYLANDNGERRQVVHFIPPTTEGADAMFVFPRFDNQGKPLVSPANKRFYFKIDDKLFDKRSVPLQKLYL